MTLLHSPIDLERFWGIPPKEFDIQEFLTEYLDYQTPLLLSPERGIGRRAMIDMIDPDYHKLIQVYSEVIVPDSPKNVLGYQEDELESHEGIVVGEVDLDNNDDIIYWGAETYLYEDFVGKFITDRGVKLKLEVVMEQLRKHANKVETIIEQADELWSNRELGQKSVNEESRWVC